MPEPTDYVDRFPPLLEQVGWIASNYAGLEAALRDLVSYQFSSESVASSVLLELRNTTTVLSLAKRLVANLPAPDDYRDYASFVWRAVERAGERRAATVHASWSLIEVAEGVWHGVGLPARRRAVAPEPLAVSDLKREADAIALTGVLLNNLDYLATSYPDRAAFSRFRPPDDPMLVMQDSLCRSWGLSPVLVARSVR